MTGPMTNLAPALDRVAALSTAEIAALPGADLATLIFAAEEVGAQAQMLAGMLSDEQDRRIDAELAALDAAAAKEASARHYLSANTAPLGDMVLQILTGRRAA